MIRMATHTIEDLAIMQGLPLPVKVRMSETRVRQWVQYYGEDGVYISFSGGKDSTVLLHIVRGLYPDVPAVFVNTGLEYPEIQAFVKTFDNVEILRPKMRFDEVIRNYGYPFIGKEVSERVYNARLCIKNRGEKYIEHYYQLTGELPNSQKATLYSANSFLNRYSFTKYKPLLNCDFPISNACCNIMKKRPIKKYRKNKVGITAQIAEESRLRAQKWLQHGCNGFDMKNPISNPMAFWTEQDILHYIKENHLPIASVYGDVVQVDEDGFIYESSLLPTCKYMTTGCHRTGCIFCGYGAHLEKGEGRFQRLKRTHPKQYDYCMGGGAYDPEDGLWKPTKEGLGMAHVIDELCRLYGKDFIKY